MKKNNRKDKRNRREDQEQEPEPAPKVKKQQRCPTCKGWGCMDCNYKQTRNR